MFYARKARYDHLGHTDEIAKNLDGTPNQLTRGFCSRHSTRGECGLEDADDNYELLGSADEVQQPRSEDIKPSIFGGIIELENKP